MLTEQVAKYLAATFDDADYQAKKIRGHWVVWSHAADHMVEFDQLTIDLAEDFLARQEKTK